jgi:hypothetical protein
MGGTHSAESSDDEYIIPPELRYKHSRSTVRAPHQLLYWLRKRTVTTAELLKRLREKQSIDVISVTCTSVFLDSINHFRKWHFPKCDELRMFT